jgi:hypothetical protein
VLLQELPPVLLREPELPPVRVPLPEPELLRELRKVRRPVPRLQLRKSVHLQ